MEKRGASLLYFLFSSALFYSLLCFAPLFPARFFPSVLFACILFSTVPKQPMCLPEFHHILYWSSQGFPCYRSPYLHRTTSVTSHDLRTNHITSSQCITSHEITWHHIRSHHTTAHRITSCYITHHITTMKTQRVTRTQPLDEPADGPAHIVSANSFFSSWPALEKLV